MLRVLLVRPNLEPFVVYIENTIEEMAALIGEGQPLLQRIRLNDDNTLGLFCDDMGIMKELVPNRWFEHHQILGNFFIGRNNHDGVEEDLTEADVARWTKKFALSQSRL